MKIASVTVTSNRESIIADALMSVRNWTDICLIVDLGITDNTLDIARDTVGDKLKVVRWAGVVDNGNFSDIRNFGLDAAAMMGADWACVLDSDERMEVGNVDVHDVLGKVDQSLGLVPNHVRSYRKERFFRLPSVDRFTGKVHECVIPRPGETFDFDDITFTELPKTQEQLESKLLYLVDILTKETQDDPANPRWFYYLGDALNGLGRKEEALKAFDKCASMRGWDEESAWSCFRMACILEELGLRQAAIEICASGLTRHAGVSELAWLAGELSLRMGKADQAIYWSRIAIANGLNGGESHFIKPRIGFRYPFGAKEGPYEVMQRAYDALGMTDNASKCEKIYTDLRGEHAMV